MKTFLQAIFGGLLLLVVACPVVGQELDLTRFKAMSPRSIGPAGMSGRVTSIDVPRQQPTVIYVGTASGGLWKSESGGISWKPVFDEQPLQSIGAVAVAPSNPDVVWAGTGEGNPRNSQSSGYGIYRSLDAGQTWTLMGLETTRTIHRILIHPTNPDIVYVGAQGPAWGESQARGVYKTTDGGETWSRILSGNDRTGVADMVMDPVNPNKLIVALWEFRRWPWFFESGGEGSGIFVTLDGGKHWEKRTQTDGLPEGELGRIGLAIAPGEPERVYALVESEENAFYRSDNGGRSFRRLSTDEHIGNRPFYYADIFVDPSNENRIYSLHSTVTKSEDGGHSWETFIPYARVHPDHHAWYIHPDDPSYMINGNDGGMAITHDRGENWRFVENLPLAQFYHINFDNEIPYHVYGGMQDNGSWRGPAYVWRAGGIRNAYWTELFFGDGFDVVPDPEDALSGYAMSQGGSLGRYDLRTHESQYIKPVHPEGVKLRFNWNAAIAQDPFDPATIYYGSQFVHQSTDRGQNWTLISPDLTTNDTSKQKQLESGGLTYDVTQAENYTTLLAISPSPLERGLIWASSDDGLLHLTRDGGENWEEMSARLPGLPAGSWIPQVVPSTHEAGEAFVVANDYRRNNWNPYLYHTEDYGQTWTRLVAEEDVSGHCLSVVQDLEVPNLLFLGTENGLYLSLDKGASWTKWDEGYPAVSTIDLKIHPREGDLIIGTFGRAAWIMDDLRPLRDIARQGLGLLDSNLVAFAPPDAYLAGYGQASGTRFAAEAMYAGENRGTRGRINFWVKMPASEKDTARIEILDETGAVVRKLFTVVDTGLNRTTWYLDQKGEAFPRRKKWNPAPPESEPGGPRVLPGTYQVRIQLGERVASTRINVLPDPRVPFDMAGAKALQPVTERYLELLRITNASVDRLAAARKSLDLVEAQLPKGEHAGLREQQEALKDSLAALEEKVFDKEKVQGIYRDPRLLRARLGALNYRLSSASRPNENIRNLMSQVAAEVEAFEAEVQTFFEGPWKAYRTAVSEIKLDPFYPVEKEE